MIRRLVQRAGNYPASYEVEYYNGASLLIPVSATEHNVIRPNLTKLSIEALRDLILAAECLERDEHRSKGSLVVLPPALRRQIVDDVAAVPGGDLS